MCGVIALLRTCLCFEGSEYPGMTQGRCLQSAGAWHRDVSIAGYAIILPTFLKLLIPGSGAEGVPGWMQA